MKNVYDPVEILKNAFFGQESDWNPDAKTSITGARGIGQIQPDTWKQYAVPGENIDNAADNAAVSHRIISDLYSRYGFDPARIATAYFSGTGNVAPQKSNSPYLQDKADPTGKTTSSYVKDIIRRVNKLAQAGQDQPVSANDILSSFENTAKSAKTGAVSADDILGQLKVTAPPPPASNVPIPVEGMNPQQLAEYKASIQRGKEGAPSFFEQFHPLQAIPETVGGGVAQLGRGMGEIRGGNVATGVGNVGMGALNTILGPVLGPVSEATRFGGTLIGNPHAADVAALALPTRGGMAAIKSQVPAVRAGSGLINLIGKENIPNVLAKLERNPNLSLMDVSEPVKTVAAGLANSPETPAAQNIMRASYERRVSGRQDVVQKAIDETLGPPINVKEYLDQLKTNVKKVGQERISPAIEGAQPIGVAPIVGRLDEVIKAPGTSDETIKRLSKLKDQITAEAGKDGFIDPQKLHGIQWPLRAEAENLAKSTSGAEKNLSGPLFKARNDMVDAIDVASGRKYKPALAGFRDEKHVQEAFDKGFDIFKTKGVEDFPEYWSAWIKDAQPAEIAAAKVGALTAARKSIEGMQGGARRGETMLGPTFNQEKVSALFGKQQTAQLAGLLEDAKNMTDTNSLLYRNSKTAQVTAGQNYFKPREVGTTSGVGGLGLGAAGSMLTAIGHPEAGLVAMGLGASKGAHMGMQYLGKLADKRTATRFAELASATGSERNQLIKLLRSASQSGSGNKLSDLTSSLVRLAAP